VQLRHFGQGIRWAKSIEEVRQLIQEAIEFHLEGLREDGSYIPEAISICEYVQAG
jgi:predicted RNase H-like HicB family nuclease